MYSLVQFSLDCSQLFLDACFVGCCSIMLRLMPVMYSKIWGLYGRSLMDWGVKGNFCHISLEFLILFFQIFYFLKFFRFFFTIFKSNEKYFDYFLCPQRFSKLIKNVTNLLNPPYIRTLPPLIHSSIDICPWSWHVSQPDHKFFYHVIINVWLMTYSTFFLLIIF